MSVLKITITGVLGLIGTYLLESLKNHHEVKIINVNPPKIKDVEFNKYDLSNDNEISEFIKSNEIINRIPDTSKAKKILKDEPSISLNEGSKISLSVK